MYHVKAIGIISLIIYFLSLAGNRLGVITKRGHRLFWNLILLISFISTALAGLFLALHTIYKWELEAIEKILKWHVEFGISLSFVGIFHITWHLNYFRNIFTAA